MVGGLFAVLVGAAPAAIEGEAAREFAVHAAALSNLAARHTNRGLRAYFFGLAALGWFLQGMLAMHALCQDDFSLDARMCTEKEFWLSPNAEAPLLASAWLHSVKSGRISDFIGFKTVENCHGWNDAEPSFEANAVTTFGKPELPSCDVARPVTCCAPAQ